MIATLTKQCSCGKHMSVVLESDAEAITRMILIQGCFFYSNKYKLRKKHLLNIYRSELGHWAGPYQIFVYCSGCGGRRYLCSFNHLISEVE